MDRVRGGVFSGAMVLAGISATLISALIAIGIRQVTHLATHPTPVYIQPASGEVAVPDATSSARPAVKRPAVAQVPRSLRPAPVPARHRSASTASTGSVSSGASVAPATTPQQPATASQQPATSSASGTTSSSTTTSPSSPSATPSPSPSASAKGNGNGAGGANGNGNAGGNGNGNGGGNGHHP